jgi:MSHA pilin protein MshD
MAINSINAPESDAGTSGFMPRPKSPRAGVTLIEATLCMLILSVMLVSVLTTLGAAARDRTSTAHRQQGPMLARSMMSEVLRAQYKESGALATFGPEPGETGCTRAAFDDVDDYDNWIETPPTDRSGVPLPNATGWKREVHVYYVDPANPAGSPVGSDMGLKRIAVTVTGPDGDKTNLVALRSAYSDQPSTTVVQRLTWVNVGLQIGTDAGSRRTSAVAVLNAVPVTP